MPPVRRLLLDVGGVLEVVDDAEWPRAFRARWATRLGLTPAEFDRRVEAAGLPDASLRSGVEEAYWTGLAAAVGADGLLPAMREDFWDAYCGSANVELLDALAALPGAVGLAILSNSGDGARREEERRYGFSRLFDPILYSHETGVAKPDPRAFELALAALSAAPEEVLFVDDVAANVEAARALGIRAHHHRGNAGTLTAIRAALERDQPRSASYRRGMEAPPSGPDSVPPDESPARGVGPWPGGPERWPEGERYDPELLEHGDPRNVVDRYRYWRIESIVQDLDARRHPFSVAIENWQHDLNIGSIVRTANAFAAETVHIVGRRRWNRRGAMVTDRYQHVLHHDDIGGLRAWATERGAPIVAVDNVPGAVPVEGFALPERCVLLFGQEGPGLTAEAVAGADALVEIPQYGSTRSINASAAAAIVMHEWIRRWAATPT